MQRFIKLTAFVLTMCLMLSVVPISALAQANDFTYTVTADGAIITAYNGNDTHVEIPAQMDGVNVVAIGANAFAENYTLESVTFPNTLTTVGYQAFESCVSLKAVTLPDSVVNVEEDAFFSCLSLATVTASPYLMNVGAYAFHNTKWFTRAPEGFLYVGRVLYRYVKIAPKDSEIHVPDHTVSIAPYAFEDQINITEVYLPVGMRTIGNYAFKNCYALSFVRIPPSVRDIADHSFANADAISITGANNSLSFLFASENNIEFTRDTDLELPDGDLDKNKCTDSTDLRLLMRAVVLSKEEFDHERVLSCDIVYDGAIDTKDIREWMILSIS